MSDYKAIKGLGSSRGSLQVAMRTRLYEGPDHLLLVQSTGYTEDYKRVFYKDIRYVVARKDMEQVIVGIISASLFLCVELLSYTPLPWWAVNLFALPFAAWFIVNLVKGATCRCYVNTDVQTVELPTPRRLNKLGTLITFLNSKTATGQPEVAPVTA